MKKRKLTDADNLAPIEVNIAPADALTNATPANCRSNGLGSFLDDWEAKHGELTPEELGSATKELTRPPKKGRIMTAGGKARVVLPLNVFIKTRVL